EPEEARKLLLEVKNRIARSAQSLRDTVHNVTPTAPIGVENLEYIARNYWQMEVQFKKSGDMQKIEAYQWTLLEACLKEALTNTARHSNATFVLADLEAAESIVRFMIQDNGTAVNSGSPGTGLRSLQM